MEVKPGYKQTEVGLIPNDWTVDYVGNVAHVTTGGKNTQDRVADGAYPFFVRSQSVERINSYSYDGEAVLTAGDGVGTGKVFHYINGRFDVHQRVYRISEFSEDLNGYYFYLYFSSNFYNRIMQMTAKSSVDSVRMEMITRMPIPLPPTVSEQRAIAAALGDVDGLLGGLERLIAKKRDLKQAAMQQLLTGQTRLPGFSGEWESMTIFDLAERRKELFDDGDWIESEHITSQGIRLIQTGNIGVGCFQETETKKFIYEASYNSLRCKPLRVGDLLICRLADPAGRACVLPDIGEERVVTSVDVTIFRPPSDSVDRIFLANIFSTNEWFRAVSDRSGGTTHKRISRSALGQMVVKLPPLPEQTAIASVLSDIDAELAALEARRDKTRALKQAMMQELLTGRTRLV